MIKLVMEKNMIKTCIECGGEVEVLRRQGYKNNLAIVKRSNGKKRIFVAGAYYQCKECNFKEDI